MQVSPEAVESYLKSFGMYAGTSKDKQEKVQGLYTALTKTTTRLSGMPGGGSHDKQDSLAIYADANTEYHNWLRLLERELTQLNDLLRSAGISPRSRRILFDRYVHAFTWPQVNRDVCEISLRQLHRERNAALQKIADYVNTTGNYREVIGKYETRTGSR